MGQVDAAPGEIQARIEQQREQLAGTLGRATAANGRPRNELIVIGATVVVVAVALTMWRRR